MLLAKTPSGLLRTFSTRGHDVGDLTGNAWWRSAESSLQPGEFVDGELWVPGGAEKLKTAIKNRTPINFGGFACSWLESGDVMSSVSRAIEDRGLEALPYTTAHGSQVGDYSFDIPGCDGIVLKDSMYGAWAKAKNQRTIDLVVTGIRMGVGKYWGMCGSLRCSVRNGESFVEIAKVSGMDDVAREIITEDDIGRVCEVKYERVASRGRLRHPRFVRWRDDEKQAHECTSNQDPELEKHFALDSGVD